MKRITLLLIACSLFIILSSHYVASEEASPANTEQKIDIVIDGISAINDEIKQQNIYSVIIPIIVVVIAGLLALCQVKANIISSARIKWCQDLRKTLALFLAETAHLNVHLRELSSDYTGNNKEEGKELYKKQYSNFRKVIEYSNQIKLFLNKKEIEHKKLYDLIDEYYEKSIDPEEFHNIDKLDIIETQIVEISQVIIKQAWEDAKTFKGRDIFKFEV